MLSHLVYVSKRNRNCPDVEIEKILASCQLNNEKRDVTGVLLYSEKTFVQYLEGDNKEISYLFDRIKVDHRHSQVALIALSPLKERLFPSWQMGSKEFKENSIEFISKMNGTEAREFREILSGKKKEGTKAIDLLKKFFA